MKDIIAELLAPLIAALNNIADALRQTNRSNALTPSPAPGGDPGPQPVLDTPSPEEKPVKATRKKAEPKPVEPENDPVLTPETEYEPEPEGEKVWTLPELLDMVRPIKDNKELLAKVQAMRDAKFEVRSLTVLPADRYAEFVEEFNKIMAEDANEV